MKNVRGGVLLLLAANFVNVSSKGPEIPSIEYSRNELIGYLCNPRVYAFLDLIAFAEGTLLPQHPLPTLDPTKGYRTQFSFKFFNSFHDHPRQVLQTIYKGAPLRSSAAGRYQFLQKTWSYISPKIQATNFSPLNQDLAAIALLVEYGAVEPLLQGNIAEAISKVKTVWASFPGNTYGQPVKDLAVLKYVYGTYLSHYLTHNSRYHNFCQAYLAHEGLNQQQHRKQRKILQAKISPSLATYGKKGTTTHKGLV